MSVCWLRVSCELGLGPESYSPGSDFSNLGRKSQSAAANPDAFSTSRARHSHRPAASTSLSRAPFTNNEVRCI